MVQRECFTPKRLQTFTPVTRKRPTTLRKLPIIFSLDTKGDNRTPILEHFKRYSYDSQVFVSWTLEGFVCLGKYAFQKEINLG